MVHNDPMRLVLASASPARRTTLIAAGITPIVIVSTVDEDAVLSALPGGRAFTGGRTTPADEVSALAAAKCTNVCEALIRGDTELPTENTLLVVGADSMLEINGHMLGKPHTPEVARERIRAMRRTTATLWTGHSLALLAPASSTQCPQPRPWFTSETSQMMRLTLTWRRANRCTWRVLLQWTAWAAHSLTG